MIKVVSQNLNSIGRYCVENTNRISGSKVVNIQNTKIGKKTHYRETNIMLARLHSEFKLNKCFIIKE